ncbi:nuclear transport factor 2 family protein [Micromonospora sp. WMMD882]|uniref:nuclear transport factor 2 family protein n=1 Tax=Micromonospora sp. WMMD882 TaxID=3015151 RepID=UPI00248B9703|nr:nuclear transport factor 2 family protein [Micromonospora sp. WMMD882]WBB78083.1 nuclear transport factor 2 family protein [Micromonospora sp. WMMD882]
MDTDQQRRTQAQELFARNLDLITAGRIREWVELFAPDGVLEFPYPLPGVPSRFVGHDELYAHMKDFPKQLDVRFSGLTFHETTDPDLVVAEFVGEGRGVATGRPFHQVYISVVRFSDGRIVHFRDFWNPLATIRAAASVTHAWRALVASVRRGSRQDGATARQ